MANMVNGGWVKLYRELKSKSIWQLSSPEQKVVLITILLLANHEENKWEWQGKQFACNPGQLITSLSSLAKECGDGVSIQNVRTALERFEKLGFLKNESTKSGRLITVINWDIYQGNSSNKASNKAKNDFSQNPTKQLTMLLTKNGIDESMVNSIVSEFDVVVNNNDSNKESNKRLTNRVTKELTPNKKYKKYKNDKEIKKYNTPTAEPEEDVLTNEDLYGVDPAEQYRRFLAGELNLDEE